MLANLDDVNGLKNKNVGLHPEKKYDSSRNCWVDFVPAHEKLCALTDKQKEPPKNSELDNTN